MESSRHHTWSCTCQIHKKIRLLNDASSSMRSSCCILCESPYVIEPRASQSPVLVVNVNFVDVSVLPCTPPQASSSGACNSIVLIFIIALLPTNGNSLILNQFGLLLPNLSNHVLSNDDPPPAGRAAPGCQALHLNHSTFARRRTFTFQAFNISKPGSNCFVIIW